MNKASDIPIETVNQYLKAQTPAVRKRLEEIRSIVRSLAPEATEKISYRMPSFFLNGALVWFAAFKNHIGFYPGPSGVTAFRDEINSYKNAKGSIQFPHDQPLPTALVKKIVEYRVKENSGWGKRRNSRHCRSTKPAKKIVKGDEDE